MRETMRRGTPARLLSWLLALALTLSLLPAGAWAGEGTEQPPFTLSVGTVEEFRADSYVFTEWDGSQVSADLYVVQVPEGTREVTLTFPEELLAYAYDGAGSYLAACGDYGDGTAGAYTAVVTAGVDGALPASVRVQTPYDASWNSTLLYAVTFTTDGAGEPETPEEPLDAAELAENIAARYAREGVASDAANGPWLAADMMAYEKAVPDTGSRLTGEQKQEMLDASISVLERSASPSDLAKHIVALVAMGYDPAQLTTAGGEQLDAVQKLVSLVDAGDPAVTNIYTLPYVLVALGQFGDVYEAQISVLVASALEQTEAWMDTTWGVDGISPMVLALAPYEGEADGVKEALDQGLAAIRAGQREDGSLGNAASTGLAMAAFAARGIDPDTVAYGETGATLTMGLLAQQRESGDGFLPDNTSFATEQGFRGLIALAGVADGRPCSIYDFSANAGSLVPGYASPEEQPDPEPDPPAEGEETVEVTFTLRAVGEDWLSGKTVEVDEGASAFDVFTAAIAGTGITYEGGGGYISSVTCRGTTLSEFDGGANAGWMYRVNGVSPDVGMGSYTVSDGDAVLLYYTADWTAEPDAGGMEEEPETPAEPVVEENSDGSFTVTLPEDADGPVRVAIPGVEDGLVPVLVRPDGSREVVKKSLTEGGTAHMLLDGSCTVTFIDGSRDFDDVAADAWYAGAVDFAVGRRLFAGATDTAFEPEAPLSRAMAAAVLWQLEDAPAAGESDFPDVAADAWYAGAAAWAQRSGLMAGTEEGLEPDRPVTREELAVILYRYAGLCGLDTEGRGELDAFADGGTVSPWAREAVAWAVDAGLLAGNGDGTLSPGGQTTRAEGAAMLRQMVALLVRG